MRERLRRWLAAPPAWLRWAAALACVALVLNLFWHGAQPYAVGLIPSPWDKLAHAAVFGAIAVLAWLALGGRGWRALAGGLAVGVCVAVADELRQAALPGRQPDGLDLTADILGAALAMGAAWWLGCRAPGRAGQRGAGR